MATHTVTTSSDVVANDQLVRIEETLGSTAVYAGRGAFKALDS